MGNCFAVAVAIELRAIWGCCMRYIDVDVGGWRGGEPHKAAERGPIYKSTLVLLHMIRNRE